MIVYPRNTVTYLRNNQAVSWPGFEPATASHKSNVLTITPPSHPLTITFNLVSLTSRRTVYNSIHNNSIMTDNKVYMRHDASQNIFKNYRVEVIWFKAVWLHAYTI